MKMKISDCVYHVCTMEELKVAIQEKWERLNKEDYKVYRNYAQAMQGSDLGYKKFNWILTSITFTSVYHVFLVKFSSDHLLWFFKNCIFKMVLHWILMWLKGTLFSLLISNLYNLYIFKKS